MSIKEKKGNKLAGLFSSGPTSPRGKRGSSSSDEEGERLLLESKKLKSGHKTFTRSKTTSSSSPESDYAALKEATALHSNDKLKRSGSVGKKVGSSSSLTSVSKKHVLQIEVNLLTRLSEQNDRLVLQERLIAILEDRSGEQEARVAMLESVISNIQKEQQQQQGNEGCIGNWLTSMFT